MEGKGWISTRHILDFTLALYLKIYVPLITPIKTGLFEASFAWGKGGEEGSLVLFIPRITVRSFNYPKP